VDGEAVGCAGRTIREKNGAPSAPYERSLLRIVIRFFAIVRDKAGTAQADLELPAGATAAAALERIVKQFPGVREFLPRAAIAVNQAYVKPDTVLHDGDELAIIPPVSGG